MAEADDSEERLKSVFRDIALAANVLVSLSDPSRRVPWRRLADPKLPPPSDPLPSTAVLEAWGSRRKRSKTITLAGIRSAVEAEAEAKARAERRTSPQTPLCFGGSRSGSDSGEDPSPDGPAVEESPAVPNSSAETAAGERIDGGTEMAAGSTPVEFATVPNGGGINGGDAAGRSTAGEPIAVPDYGGPDIKVVPEDSLLIICRNSSAKRQVNKKRTFSELQTIKNLMLVERTALQKEVESQKRILEDLLAENNRLKKLELSHDSQQLTEQVCYRKPKQMIDLNLPPPEEFN